MLDFRDLELLTNPYLPYMIGGTCSPALLNRSTSEAR